MERKIGMADALQRLQAETAAELDADHKPQMKIDTSPFILSPIKAERKPAIRARAFIRLHVISARREGEL